jgi:hypothetical protein
MAALASIFLKLMGYSDLVIAMPTIVFSILAIISPSHKEDLVDRRYIYIGVLAVILLFLTSVDWWAKNCTPYDYGSPLGCDLV